MPANWAFADSECHQLYAYINYLKNQGKETPKGDTAAGKLVYTKSGCVSCHMMNGQGNSFGPDLSQIGASRNAAYLREAIIDPGATLPESTDPDNGYGFSLYLPVKIITVEGKEITGLRVNEDTYTIQIKDVSNNYYSFNKEQLRSVEKEYGQSLMPSFKTTLTNKEIENIVAYLYKSGNQ
jgi:cytochrome c oxidase cbb3-type subunit III